jgi:hypothetical protein
LVFLLISGAAWFFSGLDFQLARRSGKTALS